MRAQNPRNFCSPCRPWRRSDMFLHGAPKKKEPPATCRRFRMVDPAPDNSGIGFYLLGAVLVPTVGVDTSVVLLIVIDPTLTLSRGRVASIFLPFCSFRVLWPDLPVLRAIFALLFAKYRERGLVCAPGFDLLLLGKNRAP